MNVSEGVRGVVRARFQTSDADEVERRLAKTDLPFLSDQRRERERDRVHLAILKLAAGNLQRFNEYLALAATDWRDVLVAAGLANEDWPDALRAAGFPVP